MIVADCNLIAYLLLAGPRTAVARKLQAPLLTNDRRLLDAGTGRALTPEDFLATP